MLVFVISITYTSIFSKKKKKSSHEMIIDNVSYQIYF